MLDALAFLLQPAEFGVAVFQRPASLDELLVDQQALIQIGLALGFQLGDGVGAGRQLFGDLGAARLDLAQLRVHA